MFEERVAELEALAQQQGLDFFSTSFEIVPQDIMTEVAAYGLPTRARHWSYGKVYQSQRLYGTMGLSKIYEIVLNSDPSLAFLLDTNPEIANLLVAAHVFGHVDFFKHNALFAPTNRNMINDAVAHALRIDAYIERYGLETVEHLMDIGFALDRHIDPHLGVTRPPYPQRQMVEKEHPAQPYDDLFNAPARSVTYEVLGERIPPHPEHDLLWFLSTYATLEPWQQDVLQIIREESYYFYPQFLTKILNEGWACVTGDTRIVTDHGMIPIRELVRTQSHIRVFDGESYRQVTNWYSPGTRRIYRIRTRRGYQLCASETHRILIQHEGETQWKAARDITAGDRLVLAVGDASWPSELQSITWTPPRRLTLTQAADSAGVSLSTIIRHAQGKHLARNLVTLKKRDQALTRYRHNLSQLAAYPQKPQKTTHIPTILDRDLAAFLGYVTGDGHVRGDGKGIGFTTGDYDLVERFARLAKSLFGFEPTIRWDDTSKNGRWRLEVYSVELVRCLEWLGYTRGKAARSKIIPELVLRSPGSVISAFLAAYFDCDGCVSLAGQSVILITASEELSRQVQEILLHFGILCSRGPQKDGCYRLTVCGKSVATFQKHIGFFLKRKADLLQSIVDNHRWFHEESHQDEVIDVTEDKAEVFDLTVEKTHRYAAGGFINHNSYWHAELFHQYSGVSPEEMIEFARLHAGVVNPGSRFSLNPYYLGYSILVDIEERWDTLHAAGKASLTGRQKLFEVRRTEDDISFLRNYLTVELMEKLELFTYGRPCTHPPGQRCPQCARVVITSRDQEAILEALLAPRYNYGVPRIVIRDVVNNTLYLEHLDRDTTFLERRFATQTLAYMAELWKHSVFLLTNDEHGNEVNLTARAS